MVELTKFNTTIICVYITPNSNINTFIEILDTIINDLINRRKSIIIVGDFNIDFLGSNVNLQLQTMLNSYGLQAIVDDPRNPSRSKASCLLL
jgi:exonuclease III